MKDFTVYFKSHYFVDVLLFWEQSLTTTLPNFIANNINTARNNCFCYRVIISGPGNRTCKQGDIGHDIGKSIGFDSVGIRFGCF